MKSVLELDEQALRDFTRRIESVPRFLAARNARLGNPVPRQDLADITQDVLVLIWKKLPSFRGHASLETWFYRICSLELMNGIRKAKRHSALRAPSVEDTPDEPASAPSEAPDARLRLEDLHLAVDRLDPQEAAIVRLRHFEELDFASAAARLGIGTSLAKARYYNALKNLRRRLRRDWDQEDS